MNNKQQVTYDSFRANRNLVLQGLAGTGKSFNSVYLALEQILDPSNDYKKLIIVRSTVPTREIGFLPGDYDEKISKYEAPYHDICEELFSYKEAYNSLKVQNNIEFISTSFIRGITWNDAIIIVDEVQNLTFHELDSVITRVGNGSKIVFCGDYNQSDLLHNKDRQGMQRFMSILKNMQSFKYIEFGVDDIVRSDFVKNYIVTKHRIENNNGL